MFKNWILGRDYTLIGGIKVA